MRGVDAREVREVGSYNEYAQYTLTLLAYVVERAVGEDLQAFAQRELFGPLGIERREWFRILMRGVRDADIPDPGPLPDREPAPLTLGYFVDSHALTGAIGVGRQAPAACNALGCDHRIAVEGLLQTGVDAAATAVRGVTGG